MTKKRRHKLNSAIRRNHRRKDHATLEKGPGKPRTIGQIIDLGPDNQEEESRLVDYRRKKRAACKAFLPNRSPVDPMVHRALERAIRDLRITHGEFRHAVQTRPCKESRVLLEKTYGRAEELLRSGEPLEIPAPRHDAVFTTNKLIGFGGYPAKSCQICGRFLTTICYSQIRDRPRVPRTDKICPSCFESLEKNEQREYQQYRYSTRWEPWGNMGGGERG